MALRVPVDEPVATVVNRPRPCFRRSAARLARPRRMARVRGSFPGLTARLGHARETPTGTAVVDAGRWATLRGPFLIGDDPFTCRGEACLARPRRMARERENFAAQIAQTCQARLAPTRIDRGRTVRDGRCAIERREPTLPRCQRGVSPVPAETVGVAGPLGPGGAPTPAPAAARRCSSSSGGQHAPDLRHRDALVGQHPVPLAGLSVLPLGSGFETNTGL